LGGVPASESQIIVNGISFFMAEAFVIVDSTIEKTSSMHSGSA
jgi:hypothetical protein